MAAKHFEWTDQLVSNFVHRHTSMSNGVQRLITEFKDSFKPEQDWFIMSVKDNHYYEPVVPTSVKRLSDGERFQIGDLTNYGEIKRFETGDRMWVHLTNGSAALLSFINKVKKPVKLFTTEDGKDVFDGDRYWWVGSDFVIMESKGYANVTYNFSKSQKLFSTEKAAQDYVIDNKPCLSLDEFYDISQWPWDRVKELVKSKLNMKDL